MSYIWFKTELQLSEFQKQTIDNGIKLQRNMWNFMIEHINPLVTVEDVNVQVLDKELQGILFEYFYEEIKRCGLGTRMIRSIVKRYIQAWKNYFNPNMQNQGQPNFHSCKKSTQSLTFVDTTNAINNNVFFLSLYDTRTFGVPNPIKKPMVGLKLKEDSTKYLSKYENLKPKNYTIIRRKNRYFLCINYECTYKRCVSMDGEIGLDWGLVDYFIDSNGRRYNIPKSAERQLQRIKALQKVLSKKTKRLKKL